jgi:hypothetical protein
VLPEHPVVDGAEASEGAVVTRAITHDGVTDSVSGWAKRLGMPSRTLSRRFESGWSVAMALTAPVAAPRNPAGVSAPTYEAEPFRLMVLSPGFMVSTESETPRREHSCANYEACLSVAARHEWQAECPGECPARADRDPLEAFAMATLGRGSSPISAFTNHCMAED